MNRAIQTILLPHNYYLGKNILITGGGSGLGKQMATLYEDLGEEMSIVGRSEQKLKETQEEIERDSENTTVSYLGEMKNCRCVHLANNLEQERNLRIL